LDKRARRNKEKEKEYGFGRRYEMTTSHQLSTIVYAQGFIEDYIENNTQPLVDVEENSEENEYREHVIEMWRVLSAGLDQIRKENVSLQNKITLVTGALNITT
jgi:hypothetical protein